MNELITVAVPLVCFTSFITLASIAQQLHTYLQVLDSFK